MDISDFLALFAILGVFPLLYTPYVFVHYAFPVLPIILGLGLYHEKGNTLGIFLSFVASFSFFRLLFCLIVKLAALSPHVLPFIGIFFLIFFGLFLIFPQYAPWNKLEDSLQKGALYNASLGFIWSFWIGLYKEIFTDYYEPKWIGAPEIYLTLISSVSIGIVLVGLSIFLSKIYSKKYFQKIQRVLGLLTILTAILLSFNLVKMPFREELRPEEPPPKSLSEIFNLPQK